jgi:hypothetical protein
MGWGAYTLNTLIANRYQGAYYHRKTFNVTDTSQIFDARLYVFSDDGADVYLNGARIDNDYGNTHSAVYWNRNGRYVNASFFVNGTNVIAVRQYHYGGAAYRMGFNLELVANTKGNVTGTQSKYIVVMSDGQANYECSEQNTGSASQDAIKAACDAYSRYGIVVYAVGFGRDADNTTMTAMANCTGGEYFFSSDAIALEQAFSSIAATIISNSATQTAIIEGNVTQTLLLDSAISANYTPDVPPPQPNEIILTLQTPPLQNCTANATLYPGMRVLDAVVTSYSGEYWTQDVVVNDVVIYNLSNYGSVYSSLGDPYRIDVPVSVISSNNTIELSIGIDATNSSGLCSPNNTLIYTAAVNLSTERSDAVPLSQGCRWRVSFTDNTTLNMTIPSSYSGNNSCAYMPGNITYNSQDAYQLGAYSIFSKLDFKGDGTIFVNLQSEDLEVIVTTISKVPYLWGPAIVTLEVFR